MVIPAIGTLGTGGAAKLGSEHDDGILEQSASFQILQQARRGQVNLTGQIGVPVFQAQVIIPRACSAVAVHNLDEPNTAFRKSPSRQ